MYGVYGHIWRDLQIPRVCYENHLCTPAGKSWSVPLLSHSDMCSFLNSAGINIIHFFGDSYMRHIFVAFVLALTNNYKNASLLVANEHCEYKNQFSEAIIRENGKVLCRNITVMSSTGCSGKVHLISHHFSHQGSYFGKLRNRQN